MHKFAQRIPLIACAVLSASVAFGCSCVGVSVDDAKKSADLVFRGTITAISGGKIWFRVDRVWRGRVGQTFDMPDFREGAACLGFWPALVKVGNDLLVYAQWLPPGSREGDYFTSICTRTRLASAAGEDFSALGRGKPPHP
jgi:hypothetical protein